MLKVPRTSVASMRIADGGDWALVYCGRDEMLVSGGRSGILSNNDCFSRPLVPRPVQ